jgi:hypothetical protein
LTQSQSAQPLYPEELFQDEDGEPLSADDIKERLWIEGGSNFSNLIQRTNETLKETYTTTYNNGAADPPDTSTVTIERIILVRNTGHGGHLLSQLRMAYMPDAYSGADPKVMGNLKYIVNTVPYDASIPHAVLWDETQKQDAGPDSDDVYAPFAIDLRNQKDGDTARLWARAFLLKDPDGVSSDPENQNRYGALYFTGLRPVSEADSADYMTYFSRELFGRVVRLADRPGAGDYKKTW